MQASIARYEEEQAGLFAWLQVAPLTEAQLLQRVLLPNFNAVPQKTVLDRVLQAAAWRTDAELTTTLTAISFVQTGGRLWQPATFPCKTRAFFAASHSAMSSALSTACAWIGSLTASVTDCDACKLSVSQRMQPGPAPVQLWQICRSL